MANHGTIGEFKSAQEDWQSYVERLQPYFTANDVTNTGKQRAILLSSVGPATYRLIRNLLAPDKPTDKTFKKITDIVRDHHMPKPSVTMQRFNFHSKTRKPGELVSTYIAELRRTSEHCEFGATLNDMLRDRLVCGINNQRIQRRLLAEPNLTFEKAKALAEAAERADENARELEKATPGPVGIHKIATRKTKEGGPHWSKCNTECYRCGGKHAADKCRFRDSDCHHCGEKGHITKACRSRKREITHPRSERSSRPQPHSRSTTHHLGESEEDSTAEAELHVFEVSERRSPPFVVKVQLNSCDVCMEVDTGASASIISEETFKSLWPTKAERPALTPSSRRLQTYTGQELQIRGTINVNVEYGEKKQSLPLLVATGDGPSLIGWDWMMHIRLDWKKFALDLNNLQPAPPTALQDILQKHAAFFREELGLVRGTTAKIHMDATAQPRFCKARTVPFALRVKVDEELQRLQRTGVISPVRFSEWTTPIVPVTKRDGSVRICGDYKVTVNQAALPDSYPLARIDDLFAALSGGRVFSKLDLAHAYQQISLYDESKKLVVINTQKVCSNIIDYRLGCRPPQLYFRER